MLTTICYGVTSFMAISLGLAVVIRVYPEKRWKSRTADIALYIIMAVLIACEALDSTRAFVTDIQMIVNPVINLVVLKIFYNHSFRASLLWLWLYNMMTDLLRIPLLTARGLYEEADVRYANITGGRTYLECIWNLLIIGIFIFLCIKGKSQIQIFMKKVEESLKFTVCFLMIDIIAFFLMAWMAGFGDGGYYSKDNMMINLLILLILVLLFIAYVFRSMYLYNKLEREVLFVQKEMMAKEYHFIRAYCEKEAKRLHDVKHTFLYLQNCIETGNLEHAQECLDSHLESTKNRDWKIWTGFMDLDCILNYEYKRLLKQEIEFVQDIELYRLPVQGEEMVIILGNLLDNAMEASVKCPVGNRRVELRIRQVNELCFLEVRNTVAEKPATDGTQLCSDKSDSIMHGWGMENVKQIVEKNKGEMQYICENGVFIVTISFMEDKNDE